MQEKANQISLNPTEIKHNFKSRKELETFSLASDGEIWKLFKSGNESAFIHIYNSCYDSLVNYGINFTTDRELIRDCIQDMFIELREGRTKIGDTDAIIPYLFVIFRRKISRYLKLKARSSGLQIEQVHHKFEFEISYEQNLINKQLDKEQILQLNNAVNKLSNQEREIIFLFFYEGNTYKQIADIMGYKQVKTARSLLYKALASLRKTLEPSSSINMMHLFTLL